MEEFIPKERTRKCHGHKLIKIDKSNMPDPVFKKKTVIKILAGLDKSIEDTTETFTPEIKKKKKKTN